MASNDQDVAVLARRVNRLEKEARFIRYLAVATAVVVGAAQLVSRARDQSKTPSAGTEDRSHLTHGDFESLATRQFQVTDDQGRVRASISASGHESHSNRRPVSLVLSGEEPGSRIELTAGGTGGPEVTVTHGNVGRAKLGMNGSDPLLQIMDEKGKSSAILWYMNGTPHLVLTDKNGKTRAVFGYDSAWSEGAGRPEKPAPSVMALYDERGKVVWSATGETKAASPAAPGPPGE